MFRLGSGALPSWIGQELSRACTGYHDADDSEVEEYLRQYAAIIRAPRLRRSKEESLQLFEQGWQENYDKMLREGISLQSLKPGYFRGSKFLRYDRRLIVTENLQLEFELFRIARLILFSRYLQGEAAIWEFGCGSGENLLLLAELFPQVELYGCDWTRSAAKIADYLGRSLERRISGRVFDMLDLDTAPAIPAGNAIITIHAFEQLGPDFEDILQFIISCRPSIVLQYEPVLEFYDRANRLDRFSLRYCRKRNYLQGYYERLRKLERDSEIEIMAAFRPHLGGVLHEASVLVWRPLRRTATPPQNHHFGRQDNAHT